MARKKQKGPTNRPSLILLTGLVLGILSGIAFFVLHQDKDIAHIYSKGETVNRTTFEMKLNDSRLEQFTDPDSLKSFSFIVVDVSITNTSKETIPFLPVFQSHIRAANGEILDMSPFPELTNPIRAGEIESGASVTGELSYLVRTIDSKSLFFFDPGWSEEDAVFFKL